MAKYGNTPVQWLVKDWLPTESVGLVVSPPGSYKTWLLQDLAISVATGLPFLGHFQVTNPGPVLFMQQEDWHGQIAQRFGLIASRRAHIKIPKMVDDTLIVQAPPKIPIFLHEHRLFRFDDEKVIQSWVERIRELRPRLVVLDPLYSAGSVDDFMAGTARSMFLFKQLRDEHHTTFFIAHHTRKALRADAKATPGNPAPEREDVWGSQFLNAWLETGWQIRRREELGSATIVRHFKVQPEAPRAIISFDIDTTKVPGRYDVQIRDVHEEDSEEVDFVRLLEMNDAMTIAQLVQASGGVARSTIKRRLDKLIKAQVVLFDGKKYSLTEQLDS